MAHQAGSEADDGRLAASDERDLLELAAVLQREALAHGVSVATAESCTGGLIGHAITAIAGSSAYFHGGVVSYSDEVKVGLLDVPRAMIERHGAVSAQVAVAMAHGARRRVGSDYAVAVTGVAGPDGGTEAKPVGLTYVAVVGPRGDDVRRYAWQGDRASNKSRSASAALTMLIEAITEAPRGVSS